jgi:hypothetical protein
MNRINRLANQEFCTTNSETEVPEAVSKHEAVILREARRPKNLRFHRDSSLRSASLRMTETQFLKPVPDILTRDKALGN